MTEETSETAKVGMSDPELTGLRVNHRVDHV